MDKRDCGGVFHQSVRLGSDFDVKGCKSEVLTELVCRVHLSLRIPEAALELRGPRTARLRRKL